MSINNIWHSPVSLRYSWMLLRTFSAISHNVRANSLTSGSCDPLDFLDAICRVKVGDRVVSEGCRASFSTHQPSEQSYLNLTSPLLPPDRKDTEESSNNNEQV